MTKFQKVDLLEEWNFYTPSQKETLADEYLKSGERNFDLQDFHKFLVKKFNLESYWKIVGIF